MSVEFNLSELERKTMELSFLTHDIFGVIAACDREIYDLRERRNLTLTAEVIDRLEAMAIELSKCIGDKSATYASDLALQLVQELKNCPVSVYRG